MTDAEARTTERLVRAIWKRWLPALGLSSRWVVELEIVRREPGDSDGSGWRAVAMTEARWEYLSATVAVNLELAATLDPLGLEVAIVHELFHVLLSEVTDHRFKRKERERHEERLATELARRVIALRGEKKAPRRPGGRRTRG